MFLFELKNEISVQVIIPCKEQKFYMEIDFLFEIRVLYIKSKFFEK